jgi:hypothetical protein
LGLVFSDLELLGHWLGVLGWLAAALLTIPLFRQENRLYAALIGPLFVTFQPVMYTSLGMETPLLAALMLAVAVFWLRGRNKIAVLLAALLILTRHDSALWLLLIGLEVGRRRLKSGKPLVEALPWREGLAAAGLTAVWFLFAWFRYGSPLPNSAAAKIGQTNLMPVQGQPPFVLALMEAFIDGMPGFMFVVLPAFLLFSFYLIGRRVRRFWWLLVWPVLYILLYTLLNVANFPWYFVPPLTVLSLALALTFGSLFGDDEWQDQPSTSILLASPIRRGTAVLALLLILYTQAFLTLNNQDKAGYRAS